MLVLTNCVLLYERGSALQRVVGSTDCTCRWSSWSAIVVNEDYYNDITVVGISFCCSRLDGAYVAGCIAWPYIRMACLCHSIIIGNRPVFTALHGMQTRSSDENFVCLSVCLSVTRVDCDKTVERSVQIYIPYERTFSLVLWEEEWLVGGRPLLPEILGQPTPIGAKSPIFNQ